MIQMNNKINLKTLVSKKRKKYAFIFILALILATISIVINLALILYQTSIINEIQENLDLKLNEIFILFCMILISQILSYIFMRVNIQIENNISKELILEFNNKFYELSYYYDYSYEDYLTIINTDIKEIVNAIYSLPLTIIVNIINLIITFLIIININIFLTVITVLYAIIMVMVNSIFINKIVKVKTTTLTSLSIFQNSIQRFVKFKKDDFIFSSNKNFKKANMQTTNYFNKNISLNKLNLIASHILILFNATFIVALLLVMFYQDKILLGTVFLFQSQSNNLKSVISDIYQNFKEYIIVKIYFQRITKFFGNALKTNFKNKKIESIEVVDLKVQLGKHIITVDNISFKKGINVIIGENGCGKSTLINCIYGLIRNYEGKIIINDLVKSNEENLSESVSYLPQSILEKNSLSHGEHRYLYLKKIVSSNNNVIILDEPFNYLDKKNRIDSWEYCFC